MCSESLFNRADNPAFEVWKCSYCEMWNRLDYWGNLECANCLTARTGTEECSHMLAIDYVKQVRYRGMRIWL